MPDNEAERLLEAERFLSECISSYKSALRADDARRKAETYELAVKEAVSGYEDTKNPLFLWFLYRFARENGMPIPEEFLEYLDVCAENITGFVSSPPNNIDAVGEACGFSTGPGPGSMFSDYQGMQEQQRAACLFAAEFILHGRLQQDSAMDAVSEEMNISKSTVRRLVIEFYGNALDAYRNGKKIMWVELFKTPSIISHLMGIPDFVKLPGMTEKLEAAFKITVNREKH